jgi:Glycosyl transferase family 11
MLSEVKSLQIILSECGGLGNQLFRYAALRYFAKRYGAEMKISVEPARYAQSYGYPRPFLLSHFAIAVPMQERSLGDRLLLTGKPWLRRAVSPAKRALQTQVFIQDFSCCHSFLRDLPLERHVKRLHLVGYWHTYIIVEEVAAELRSELTLKEPAKGKNLEMLERITKCTNPVSLHVRRGDCTVAATNRVDLPLEYYLNAIAFFEERLGDPTFFVFSDDVEFVKGYLPRDVTTVFIEHNDDFNAHEDLRLMSSCHHHIIANSTFSWWGAWLNHRGDKRVIAPKQWYNAEDSYYPDFFPPTWMLVDVAPVDRRFFIETEEASAVSTWTS